LEVRGGGKKGRCRGQRGEMTQTIKKKMKSYTFEV
jgi:hypothetical protein